MLWPSPRQNVVDLAKQRHLDAFAASPWIASAPATFPVIGEHVARTGGLTIVGLAAYRCAVALSPSPDSVTRVHAFLPGSQGEHDGCQWEQSVDTTRTDTSPAGVQSAPPESAWAARAAALIATLTSRQLSPREHTAYCVTICSDIPPYPGLGAVEAAETALALALYSRTEQRDDAPARTKLVHALQLYAAPLRQGGDSSARYHAALRGLRCEGGACMAVIDHSDGSITPAGHLAHSDPHPHAVVALAPTDAYSVPLHADKVDNRQLLIGEACSTYGVDTLTMLPDAADRVHSWADAVHTYASRTDTEVPKYMPSAQTARAWTQALLDEHERSRTVASSLRSRKTGQVFAMLNESAAALITSLRFGDSDDDALPALLRLSQTAGAAAARPLEWGLSPLALSTIPAAHLEEFISTMNEHAVMTIPLAEGSAATIDLCLS